MGQTESSVRAVGAADFATAVLERSRIVPVVVDFWAAWCGPCRTVAPILERLAADYAGLADVVKVDTDAEPEIAAQFGVRSLPTLALFARGVVADALIGAHPEGVLRAFIDRHVARPADRERAAAREAARAGDVDGAVATLERLAASEANRPEHFLALIDVLTDAGRLDEAAARIDAAPFRATGDPGFGGRRARLEIARAASGAGAPGTTAAQHAAAAQDFLAGRHAEAIEAWLALMRAEPHFDGDALPRSLKAAFQLLGDDHELVGPARRRLALLMH